LDFSKRKPLRKKKNFKQQKRKQKLLLKERRLKSQLDTTKRVLIKAQNKIKKI
jgi:hypothetical protein